MEVRAARIRLNLAKRPDSTASSVRAQQQSRSLTFTPHRLGPSEHHLCPIPCFPSQIRLLLQQLSLSQNSEAASTVKGFATASSSSSNSARGLMLLSMRSSCPGTVVKASSANVKLRFPRRSSRAFIWASYLAAIWFSCSVAEDL